MIGERNERVEELEADVAEMRAVFRDSLDAAASALHAALLRAGEEPGRAAAASGAQPARAAAGGQGGTI
jgi:hypothetical protein